MAKEQDMSEGLPPLPNDLVEAIGAYWDTGYEEGKCGIGGDAANQCLSAVYERVRDYARAAVLQERERCYSLVLESPYRARKGASWKSIAFDVLTRIRDGECPHIPPAAPQTIEPPSNQGVPMNDQQECATFEAWFKDFRHAWKTERDVALSAWQAGRAALAAQQVPHGLKLVVGALPTLNQDPYPALGDWWVQLWTGRGESDKVVARAYGATPDEAGQMAERIASALAAAPQAPLTDEQIDSLWVATPEDPDGNDFVAFARAIEAAHGIAAGVKEPT